jgi:hypothetical protein
MRASKIIRFVPGKTRLLHWASGMSLIRRIISNCWLYSAGLVTGTLADTLPTDQRLKLKALNLQRIHPRRHLHHFRTVHRQKAFARSQGIESLFIISP